MEWSDIFFGLIYFVWIIVLSSSFVLLVVACYREKISLMLNEQPEGSSKARLISVLLSIEEHIQKTPLVASIFSKLIPKIRWISKIRSAPIIISVFGFGWFQHLYMTNESLYLSGLSGLIAVASLALCSIPLSLAFAYNALDLKPTKDLAKFGFYSFIFTATIGMVFLLFIVQPFSSWIQSTDFPKPGRLAFLYIFELIGWSYENMFNPDSGFFKSAIAFTFSAGLCEEFVKLSPVFFSMHALRISGVTVLNKCDISSALKTISVQPSFILFVGFMSGIGFGVCEAIVFYSPWSRAPQLSLNFLRWFSLVPMHAVWALIDTTILIWAWPKFYNSKVEAGQILDLLLIVLAASALHGFYNSASMRSAMVAMILQLSAIIISVFLVKRVLSEAGEESRHIERFQSCDVPFTFDVSKLFPLLFFVPVLLVSIVYGLSDPIEDEGGYRTVDDQWYFRTDERRNSQIPVYQTPSVFPCPACGGRGMGYVPLPAGMRDQGPMVQVCSSCGGSGVIRR